MAHIHTPTSRSMLRRTLRTATGFLPDRGRSLKHLRWHLYLGFWNQVYAWRWRSEPARADPRRIYWIEPERIQYVMERPRDFHSLADRGRVLGGTWDLPRRPFDDLPIASAVYQRIHENRPWCETAYYDDILARIEAGRAPYGLQSQHDLDQRCVFIDHIISSMRHHGYRLSSEIELPGEDKNAQQQDAEILCNIDRDGRYLFYDGQHRLAIAKTLGIVRVPVKILIRHRSWQDLRNELHFLAQKQNGALYQPALHPDLTDIAAHHCCEDRFNAIQAHLRQPKGTLLDLGANLCYFCHRFEQIGYDGVAVESDPLIARLAERLRIAEDRNFRIVCNDLLDEQTIPSQKFDIVLALNIFHHFLKTQETYSALEKWLQTMAGRVGMVFFEPHHPAENQMRHAYRNYAEQQFVEFIRKNLRMRKSEHIYRSTDARNVFLLYND